MEYRRLGHSGLQVSALSLGSWITFGGVLSRGEVRELVAAAFDAGINLFDSAENYTHGAAEQLLGDVLADLRLPRDAFCVCSKAFFGAQPNPAPTQRGLSRKHLRDACDAALRRLQVEYLDLFLCHRPDPETPVEETVAAMDQLVRAGKVLYWGTSEWPADTIREAARFASANGMAGPSTEQAQYNLLHREQVEFEYAGLHADFGLGLMVTSPLASGLLTGKYSDGAVPPDSRLARQDAGWQPRMMYGQDQSAREAAVQRLIGLAHEVEVAPGLLALAWCLAYPRVSTVILGCSSLAQLQQNLRALELAPQLDEGTLARLNALSG